MQRAFGMDYSEVYNHSMWLPGFFSIGEGGCTIDQPLQPLSPTDQDTNLEAPLKFLEEEQIKSGLYSDDLTKKRISTIEYVTHLTTKCTMQIKVEEIENKNLNEAAIFVCPEGNTIKGFTLEPFETTGEVLRYLNKTQDQFTIGGVFVDKDGTIYMSSVEDKCIYVFNKKGDAITTIDGGGSITIGTLGGLCVGIDGNVYVCDSYYHMVYAFTKNNTLFRQFGLFDIPEVDGNGFNTPVDIKTDSFGNFYILDKGNHRLAKYDSAGNYIKGITINYSNSWGVLTEGDQLIIDKDDDWFVRDSKNRIIIYGTNNGPTGLIGAVWSGTNRPAIGFMSLDYIATDGMGNLYVYDKDNDPYKMRVYNPNIYELDNCNIPFPNDVLAVTFGSDGKFYVFNAGHLIKATFKSLEDDDFIMLSRVTFPTFVKSPMDSLDIEWYFIF